MKTQLFFLILLVFSGIFCNGQNELDSRATRDPKTDLMNFVPNEVLIKFKDDVQLKSGTLLKSAGITAVDKLMQSHGAVNLEKLFTTETRLKAARVVKDPQGRDMVIPSLHNIYKMVLPELKSGGSQPANIYQLIDDLKALPEVEYAEPNFIYSIDNLQPVGPVVTAADLEQMQPNNLKVAKAAITPNDPLYNQQWYIPAIKADWVWAETTGDATQVIAILDTGVDTEHPDLKNKIWQNPGEIAGNGIDDDGNGLIDDTNGWDYINNDNDPKDDNSHGTHVAGIAAAETNNGIGIAGVNWEAKIMPLKVFQSSGRGDVAKITQAIIYASQKGATVINMSFGSYARSRAMEDALANAYATTILVAAAGNDGGFIEECFPAIGPFFPAALSYILGVQSPDGGFSNLDCNGPAFSNFPELFNYEMKAPGTNIISTIPGGNYRVYQGTSMATPAVAAAVSLYRKLIPYDEETNEFMWVKLIQSTSEYLDIFKALTIVPKPEVWFLNNVIVDTLANCDRDGRVDAGETIQLWFRARNTGGQVDSVYWKIRLAEFEDPTTCTILKSTSFLSSISPYATRTSEKDPMKFTINSNVVHDRDITFDLLSWYKGATDTLRQKFVFTAENGEELKDILTNIKVLYPNKLYLVNQSFMVGTTGTLIIKPGTKLLFYPGKTIPISGNLIAQGKPDSLIHFVGYIPPGSNQLVGPIFSFRNQANPNHTKFSFCLFENLITALNSEFGDPYPYMRQPSVHNSIFNEVYSIGIADTLINNLYISPLFNNFYSGIKESFYGIGHLELNNFIGPPTSNKFFYDRELPYLFKYFNEKYKVLKFNNFINYRNGPSSEGYISNAGSIDDPGHKNNWISEYSKMGKIFTKVNTQSWSAEEFHSFKYQYWGTSDSSKIENMFYDFLEDPMLPRANFNPFLSSPPEECHAIVWKVLVNGKDAQDEIVEPVGVGKQRFDVYFNRQMDKNTTPNVAFGVRYPFSSNAVNEEGSWSEDGRIYTAYKTVKLTSGDGINRVRVTGAKDLEGWEIPTEDMRFEFLISAASSASNEFMATPGLGKVALEWNNNKLDDGLGFNMYRMEQINDSTLSEPVIINSSLITDTLYADFSVIPNKKYFYYYKILRTNLEETDSSKVVAAIPFTAALGDANGDLSVNVLDITTIVAYLLNQNPQPFIFEAADVNGDGQINVLDIVATVNKVLNPGKSASLAEAGTVNLYLQNDTLFADVSVPVGAIQFDFTNVSAMEEIEKLKALQGFESGYSVKDNTLRLIVYSLTGKTITAGNRIPLLKVKKGSGITNMIMGDKTGSPLAVNYLSTGLWNLSELGESVVTLGQNYPNPFDKTTTIPVIVNEPVDELVIRIINITGQEVAVLPLKNPVIGENLLHWNNGSHKGMLVYRLEVKRGGKIAVAGIKKMIVQ